MEWDDANAVHRVGEVAGLDGCVSLIISFSPFVPSLHSLTHVHLLLLNLSPSFFLVLSLPCTRSSVPSLLLFLLLD
ncbi:hypothetical protein B0H19DRAFT_1156226 [Mycena capillaripes]|nr:hypothetical protein B0H19DRAFT_1156226 [Mycena capillaripes]